MCGAARVSVSFHRLKAALDSHARVLDFESERMNINKRAWVSVYASLSRVSVPLPRFLSPVTRASSSSPC